jgi:hypothetical protein
MNSTSEGVQYQQTLDKIYYIENIILKYKTLKQSANPNFQLNASIDTDNIKAINKTLNDIIKPDILRILTELRSINNI